MYDEAASVGGLLTGGGSGNGWVLDQLTNHNFDFNALRPTRADNGMTYISRKINGKKKIIPLMNASAPLRKDDWIEMDRAVEKVAKPEMRLVNDLRAAGLTYSIPDGMAKTVLQYERMTDISPATISMDGNRVSQGDRPLFDLQSLPLPIIHKDFDLPARQVMASRNGGSPLDTSTAEQAAVRVAEAAEMLTLGTIGYTQFGGGFIYGLFNYPNRITVTITDPTSMGYTAVSTVQDVLGMVQLSLGAFHRGPWKLYHSLPWNQYMDADYNLTATPGVATQTLRERLSKINNITTVELAEFMHTGYSLLLVEQKSGVIRMVMGMDVTTLQWESQGGLKYHFKILCIMVPQLRCDTNGNTGIVHGYPSGKMI